MPAFPSTATLLGMVDSFKNDDANMAAKWFPVKDSLSNSYEFDIVSASRGKVGYRHPDGTAGMNAARSKTRKTVLLPSIREKKMLKESTLRWMDAPGKKSPEKLNDAISAELKDLDFMIERTHEYARWKLLTTGAITLTGDFTDTYTFGIGTTATDALPWDTPATSDPIGSIISWKESVAQESGVQPTEIVFSTLGLKYFFESTQALKILGEATKDKYRETGYVPKIIGMDVIVQDGGYRDDNGVFKFFLSDDGVEGNMCIIKTPGDLGVTAQGPTVDSKAPDGFVGKFAKSFETDDPSGRWILEAHTCLPGLTKTNQLGAFVLW